MKCKILHQSRGRIRVHLCTAKLTLEQAAQRALELTNEGFGPSAAAKAAAIAEAPGPGPAAEAAAGP